MQNGFGGPKPLTFKYADNMDKVQKVTCQLLNILFYALLNWYINKT